VPLSLLYQTSTNAVRQDFQALIKQWWSEIGIETELRNIDASVFFGGDPGSPGHLPEVLCRRRDVRQQLRRHRSAAYLGNWAARRLRVPKRQWQGENINRFCMAEEYDALVAELTARPAKSTKRAEIAKKLNDMI
jgi:peptide/nickel transport system substrate-binding protein